MQLYQRRLVKGGGCVGAVYGCFSGGVDGKVYHEVVVNHGSWLEVLRIDSEGEMHSIGGSEAFGVVRNVAALRFAGTQRDMVVVTSDAGRVAVLQFNANEHRFERIAMEGIGKSGVRRIVPGQYLAVDPHGRSIMIGAVEKQKMVFNVARDSSERVLIASPLEANRANTLSADLKALMVGLENPSFAAIELDYSQAEEKVWQRSVAVYEVEEGLNHVVRKSVHATLSSANMLVPLPPPSEQGPGGVLVCSEDSVEYRKCDSAAQSSKYSTGAVLRVVIPRRVDVPNERSTLIVASAVSVRKIKGAAKLLVLLQSEYGDLFKVDVEMDGDKVRGLSLRYFDTIPVAKALCLTRRGHLFAASEFGDHRCYRLDAEAEDPALTHSVECPESQAPSRSGAPVFAPRENKNIRLTSAVQSLAPALGIRVADLFGEEKAQLLVAQGRGARSRLSILRHGLEVTEIAVQELGGTPSNVWTVKRHGDASNNDDLIVLSFANVTMVLAVGEASVEPAADSGGLKANVSTLAVGRMEDGSIVQVHRNGMHRTKGGGWSSDGKVECACVNARQVVLAMEGGRVAYFEMDASGELSRHMHDLGEDIKCLDFGEIQAGRARSGLLAAGTFTNAVQVLSLGDGTGAGLWRQLATQALPDQASSLALVDMHGRGLTLCAGLRNGVLVRSKLDEATGKITDSRSTFLGSAPVRCSQVRLPCDGDSAGPAKTQNALLALSSRPWLYYSHLDELRTVPLSYQQLGAGCAFASAICDGLVAISGSSMRILALDDLSQQFNSKNFRLGLTPRAMLVHEKTRSVVLVEGDHNVPSQEDRAASWETLKQARNKQYPPAEPVADGGGDNMDTQSDDEGGGEAGDSPRLSPEQVGLPKCGRGNQGRWSSQVRLLNPSSGQQTVVALGENELGLSACLCKMGPALEEFLVVSCCTALELHPQRHSSACIKVFRITASRLTLVHATTVEGGGLPRALCALPGGLVAVGAGSFVRMFALGQSKLLLKAENRTQLTQVVFMKTHGNRIYCGDANESVHILKFSLGEMSLVSFADDTQPRSCVAGEVLDYDTIAASDKLGNLFVLRLPSDVGDTDVQNVAGGDRMLWDQAKQSGAPNKLDPLAQVYLGELVTGMHKAAIMPGKAEALFCCTVMGSVFSCVPFPTKGDLEFFCLLEMHMRSTPFAGIVAREHLPYKSYFAPVKGVVDGDLCCLFDSLPSAKQAEIAKELDRTVEEVSKKILDLDNCVL